MFREDQVTPVIVDFGLVRDLSSTSLTQTWIAMGPGTPYYAAPEQLTNDKELIDWRTDQFALGILLAESALGYHPYSESGDTTARTVERVAQREGPTDHCKADLAREGLPAITRMIASWPVRRFRTPRDLGGAWLEQGAER
jgi:serine/threonine protein kinase